MISSIIEKINSFVWGIYMQAFLVGTGIFLMVRLKFIPLRKLGFGIKQAFSRHKFIKEKGAISPFQALMTSLAGTIGTANIAGVATAIALGGPGAIFWMWITAVFGMATKYSESVLAIKYRIKDERGEFCGGPMYTLSRGFKKKSLGRFFAVLFSLFAVTASFGIGNMTQANSVAAAINTSFGIDNLITGIVLSLLSAMVILGGIKTIAKVTSKIVPLMGSLYILGGLAVVFLNIEKVLPGLLEIVRSAFSGRAVIGGFGGAATAQAIRYGISRGVFSNEAGLGSAPIAAAAAKTDYPARQGFVSMTGTFFDTLVICTITALVISVTGVWYQIGETGVVPGGASLTIAGFSSELGDFGEYIVTLGLALFAFSSILAWSYYGEKCLQYLTKRTTSLYIYRIVFCTVIILGAATPLKTVWNLSDIANGLMAIPNLVSVLILRKVIVDETESFIRHIKKEKKKSRPY